MAEFASRLTAEAFQVPRTNDDRRHAMRTVPMELLCLGLGRTGTSSLRQALFILGYPHVYHMHTCMFENKPDADWWAEAYKRKFEGTGKPFSRSDYDRLLGGFQAVTDYPPASFAPELVDAYPEAKLILTLRDSPQAWKKSVQNIIWPSYVVFGPPSGFFDGVRKILLQSLVPNTGAKNLLLQLCKHTLTPDFPEYGEQLYTLHNDEVRALARARGREMLEFNAKEGWGPLCKFLDKPIPLDAEGKVIPFPRVNDTANSLADFDTQVKAELLEYFWSQGVYNLMSYLVCGGAIYMAFQNKAAIVDLVRARFY